MNHQKQLQVLEVNLSGTKINVGMPNFYKDRITELFSDVGVTRSFEMGDIADGSIQKVVRDYLENGRNYVIFDRPVKLESQPTGENRTNSIVFGLYPHHIGKNHMYLHLQNIDVLNDYSNAKKVNFRDVWQTMEEKKLFEFQPTVYTMIAQFDNFKHQSLKERIIQKVDSPKVTESYTQFDTKQRIRRIHDMMGVDKVVPPACQWILLKNYPLADIEKNFILPDYQRRVDKAKVGEVIEAMKVGAYADNSLRTKTFKEGKMLQKAERLENILLYDFKKLGNGPIDFVWEVVDGQHKLYSFLYNREHEGLKVYDLMLQNFDKKYSGRDLYTGLNSGKPVGPDDRIKAMDDRSILFFNETRELLTYYPTGKNISFKDMATAQFYVSTGNISPRLENIKKFIPTIKKEETDKMNLFLLATASVWGVERWGKKIYGAPIFRNAYRVFFEKKKMEPENLKTFLKKVQSDKRIMGVENRDAKGYQQIYNLTSRLADNLLSKKWKKSGDFSKSKNS